MEERGEAVPNTLGFTIREDPERRRTPTATVALHDFDGMVRAGHVAGVVLDENTVSVIVNGQVWAKRVSLVTVSHLANIALRGAVFGEHIDVIPNRPRIGAPALRDLALQAVGDGAAVAVERPTPPVLSDAPVANIRVLFDLTWAEFARLFGITERHAHRWQSTGVPEDRRRAVDALQAVGLTVIGGLGPVGAKLWLRSGVPTGEQLVADGRIDELVARADALTDSPLT